MAFNFVIPGPNGNFDISVEAGSSLIFVGANGGGKTRLSVMIENSENVRAHRISAHRALMLNPSVAKISEEISLAGLRTGNAAPNAHINHREGSRWGSKPSVGLLNDYDFLIQALFADQANVSLRTHTRVRAGDFANAEATKFELLNEIWKRLLPHRTLHFTGDDIKVSIPNTAVQYPAAEMSDGERAIFYLIAQTLAAARDSLLIFDEPELHVHRSIMAKLWDELEAARQDCAFVLITHDLEFAAVRAAQKFAVRDFNGRDQWTIENVPQDSGFNEELTTLILGSRRPVLFVESEEEKFDVALYRACYPSWTVVPRGSCSEVIHSVVTMRRNASLTRVECRGIVDADGHVAADVVRMSDLGVKVLPVTEIENLFALPEISRVIAMHEGFLGDSLTGTMNSLKADIFTLVNSPGAIDAVVLRHCRRRIDRAAKKIGLDGATNVDELTNAFTTEIQALNIPEYAETTRTRIRQALQADDLARLLSIFDNKGILALAAARLKNTRKQQFEGWLTRVLRNDSIPTLSIAIRNALPNFD